MPPQLITHWTDHDLALTQILARARRSLHIFDRDLLKLRLESPAHAETLRRLLAGDQHQRIQIVVRDAGPLRRDCPRLMRLLATYPQRMLVCETPAHLAELSDAMVIVDDSHALVRFHQDHARAKLISDDPIACAPYIKRFAEILGEGGEPVSATTLGL